MCLRAHRPPTTMARSRDEGLIEAFVEKQRDVFIAYKGALKCGRDGCVGVFNSNGRGGNSSTNGIKRMQLKCSVCQRATGLHIVLESSTNEIMRQEASILRELYMRASGRRKQNRSAGVEEQEELAARVAAERMEAAMNTPLPESEDSTAEGEVGEEGSCENEWKEVRSRRRSKRGAAEVEYTPDDQACAQKRSDLRATPLRGSITHGCEHTACKDRMLEMNERIKAQDVELKAFHKSHAEMLALVKRQSVQLESQNVQIARLESLLKDVLNMPKPSCPSSPNSHQAGPTTPKAAAPDAGVTGPGAGSSQEPTPAEAYAKPADAPPSTYASAAAKSKFIPKKEFAALKRCVSPPKPPAVMEKIHFRFYWNQNDVKSHRDAFKLAYNMLSAVGVKSKVRDISFIGRSVLELYVESEHVRVVIESMRKWIGKDADTFIPASEIRDYPLHTSKWSADDLKAKARNRAAILCARNPAKHMQVCILADFGEAERVEILEKAKEMRASWQDAESDANEPKGMSDQSCP